MASYKSSSNRHSGIGLGIKLPHKMASNDFLRGIKEKAARWRFSIPARGQRLKEATAAVEGIIAAESSLHVFIHQSNLLDVIMDEVTSLQHEIKAMHHILDQYEKPTSNCIASRSELVDTTLYEM